jgi:type II secretory pathway pseudopilin PulG
MAGRARTGDEGITLVETLTAMMIVTIVLALVSGALATVSRAQKVASERTDTAASNRVGFETLTRLLRQATYPAQSTYVNSTIVSYAGPTRIVFTARRGAATNAVPKRYEFALQGTDLVYGSTTANCADATSPCSYGSPVLDRVAARWIRNAVGGGPCAGAPTSGAIFHYYAADATAGGVLTELTVPASGYLSGDQLVALASVGIELYTDVVPGKPLPGCESIKGLTVLRNRVQQ